MRFFPISKPSFSWPIALLFGIQGIVVILSAWIGKVGLFPQWIHPSGFFVLASDSFSNHDHAIQLSGLICELNFSEWWSTWARFHTRIASLFYVVFGTILGEGILSAWPMNIILLWVTYRGWRALVEELGGNPSKGTWCLMIPTLVFHYTQLLRDPFYISFFLWWILGWVKIFNHRNEGVAWKGLLLVIAFSPLLYWSRERFWALAQMITLMFWVTSLFCLCIRRKTFFKTFIAVSLLVFLVNGKSMIKMTSKWLGMQVQTEEEMDGNLNQTGKLFFFYKIAVLREDFLRSYPGGTSLYPDRRFSSDLEVLLNVPSSTLTGLLAPLPLHLLSSQGKAGIFKWITLPETVFVLGILFFLLLGWLKKPPTISELILMISVLSTLVALGLVVTNLGALYRMRLASWCILLAIWAARNYSSEEVSFRG